MHAEVLRIRPVTCTGFIFLCGRNGHRQRRLRMIFRIFFDVSRSSPPGTPGSNTKRGSEAYPSTSNTEGSSGTVNKIQIKSTNYEKMHPHLRF
jgi:hypothetical protein